ncbi:MAG: glycoside hydrolase 100 family protein [Gammaproteobacteria bacterium]|nr:glycoside hydrolase 100 family protein [Gammaproteobacteria bacterium]MDH5730924.1 glycoside hydrolase 100 family protein [Gammaproteobacteria bacterium]
MNDKETSLDGAYQLLNDAILHYQGHPVGTIASADFKVAAENYGDCFIRDFVPSALVFLLDGQTDIVRNFLELTLNLRDQQEQLEGHQSLPKVMPASFKVFFDQYGKEQIRPDFGDKAIGRVAPVDAMMWWVILLYAYVKATGDIALAHQPKYKKGIQQILTIFLRDRFEVFPTLLVPDGCFMIDRRMGVYGHPLEIQSLFYGCLKASLFLLNNAEIENQDILQQSQKRLEQLTDYVRRYYWLDLARLNEIHRYETERFGDDNHNELNIYPESIPPWLSDWLPDEAGYLVGNIGPGRMDFRFFAFGNLLAIVFGLAEPEQAAQIMKVYDQRWPDLIGRMPVKISYPAIHGKEWHLLTGGDPKNRPWSYHNAGNWPTLLWAFNAAAKLSGREDLAEKATNIASHRLHQDNWPEYYDGKEGRLIGRRSNFRQVWSATGYILARKLLQNDQLLNLLKF